MEKLNPVVVDVNKSYFLPGVIAPSYSLVVYTAVDKSIDITIL